MRNPTLPILLILLAVSASAAEPRITSVTADAEGWQVAVSGLAAPQFLVDGKAVGARAGGKVDGNATTWHLAAPGPSSPARLVVRDGSKDLLALRLGAAGSDEAQFNDWSIYHVWLETFRNGNAGNDRAGLRRWVHPNYAGGDLQGVLEKIASPFIATYRTLSTNVELAEAEIKLGLAFEAEGGIILVKSKGSANLEVTLKLKPVRPAP